MELHEVMPYVRYCAVQKYFNNAMYRDKSYFKAYDSRLFYCMGGHGEIEVNNTPYKMSNGTLLIFKNNSPYRYIHSEEKDMVCISANFDFTYEYAQTNCNRIPPDKIEDFDISQLIDCPSLCDVMYIRDAKKIETYVIQLRNTVDSSRKYRNQEASALMKLIITKSYELYEGENTSVSAITTQLIDRICIYIDKNAETINSGKQVADYFSYHPYYINRLIAKYKGCTLHEYIRNAKIRIAIQYLTSTEMSISQIAERCGFCDSAHFSRHFKAFTGYRPSKYRFL